MSTPRLQRRGDARGRVSESASAEIPDYEQPVGELTEVSRRHIQNLTSDPALRHLREQIRLAVGRISVSAGIINERLADAKAREEKGRKRKRAELREEGQGGEEALDQPDGKVVEMERSTVRMTEALDRKVREMVDEDFRSQQLLKIFDELGRTDDEGSRPDAPKSTSEKFKVKLNYQVDRWHRGSLMKRYGDNNDYKHFKRSVHEASYIDEDAPPLPHASTWFNEGQVNGQATQGGEDEESDIEIQREKVSLRCPITLLTFKNPVTSKKCPHSFEKDAILDMIRNSSDTTSHAIGPDGRPKRTKCVRCPVCHVLLTMYDLREDLVLLRKVKRAQQLQERGDSEEDEDEDEDEEVDRASESDDDREDADDRDTSVVPNTQIKRDDPSDE